MSLADSLIKELTEEETVIKGVEFWRLKDRVNEILKGGVARKWPETPTSTEAVEYVMDVLKSEGETPNERTVTLFVKSFFWG